MTSSIRIGLIAATVATASVASADVAIESTPPPANHANHVGAFVGVTHVEEQNHFTAGLEHEYRLSALGGLFGFGPVVEYVHADHSEVIGALLVHVHAWKAINLFAGGGYERSHGHGEALVRGGASYDLHLGGASVSPTVAVDRIAGHTALIGGAAIGFGF